MIMCINNLAKLLHNDPSEISKSYSKLLLIGNNCNGNSQSIEMHMTERADAIYDCSNILDSAEGNTS